MNRETIDQLHKRAKNIGVHMARHWPVGKHNDWKNYGGHDLRIKIVNDDTLEFRQHGHDHTIITFSGITPSKITKEIIHDPVTIGAKVVDAQSTVVRNESSKDQTRTYSIEIGETKTFQEEVGISVAIGLEQTITVGNEASFVKGETKLSLDIETSYNKQWGGETSESRTTETAITVPPGKKVTVTTQRSISNLEQKCEYWCDLEHAVRIYSHRDFDWNWSSVDELKLMAKGLAPEDRDGHNVYKDLLSPLTDYRLNQIIKPLDFHYVHKLRFDTATTGDVNIQETDV